MEYIQQLQKYFSPPPAKILYVGEKDDLLFGEIYRLEYQLTIHSDFMDDNILFRPGEYDVVLLHKTQYRRQQLKNILTKTALLLTNNGRVVLYDDVLSDPSMECTFLEMGFFVKNYFVSSYEIWDLRPSHYMVKAYKEHDETVILHQFNQVFHADRTQEHWLWKFKGNPLGGPYAAIAWDDKQLAAHYTAYPLSLTARGQKNTTFHIGDTFTVPAYRGVGRGKTNLLSRVVRYFHKAWCENKIDFFYGFLTGTHIKLGKMCLAYESIAPVFDYTLETQHRDKKYQQRIWRWFRLMRGYRIELTHSSEGWADLFFEKAKDEYPLLVSREHSYLKWRYEQHPDFKYQYVLIRYFGRLVGWWVIREMDKQLLLVDALVFKPHIRQAIQCVLEMTIHRPECHTIKGWFSVASNSMDEELQSYGFEKLRHTHRLELCATFFSKKYTAEDLAEQFYFTMGDSDLY